MKIRLKNTNTNKHSSVDESNRLALVDIAVETWRLNQVIEKVCLSMDPITAERFISQYRWFQKKVNTSLNNAGLQIVDLTGMIYNLGMAVTPLNANEFNDDKLIISQMIEPIIMYSGNVMRIGSVMLKPLK